MTAATIHERGNGFPDVGSYVPGDDGQLYVVTAIHGQIQTGRSGEANWVRADVDGVDWDACDEADEYPAMVVLEVQS